MLPVGRSQKQEPLWLHSASPGSWGSGGEGSDSEAEPSGEAVGEGHAAGSQGCEEGAVRKSPWFWQSVPGHGTVLRETSSGGLKQRTSSRPPG